MSVTFPAQSADLTLHFTLYILLCTLYTLHLKLYTLHFTFYSLHFTLYTLQPKLNCLQFTAELLCSCTLAAAALYKHSTALLLSLTKPLEIQIKGLTNRPHGISSLFYTGEISSGQYCLIAYFLEKSNIKRKGFSSSVLLLFVTLTVPPPGY